MLCEREELAGGEQAALRVVPADERLGPDEDFEMSSEVVAVEGDTGIARIEVRYGSPKDTEYRDLWVVRLNDAGLCFHFEEWPFWPPGTEGAAAAGADA